MSVTASGEHLRSAVVNTPHARPHVSELEVLAHVKIYDLHVDPVFALIDEDVVRLDISVANRLLVAEVQGTNNLQKNHAELGGGERVELLFQSFIC